MQTLDVISINIWNILISLLNLTILFLAVKYFLFKPVRALFARREQELKARYDAADRAETEARRHEAQLNEKLSRADEMADEIIQRATEQADHRARAIVGEANDQARIIKDRAKADAELTVKKAEESMREQIVEVSVALTEKVLSRHIGKEDHVALIDEVMDEMGGKS